MHLVITSRADPPLPLARLPIRRELTELRHDDEIMSRRTAGGIHFRQTNGRPYASIRWSAW
ncbi:MAG: hypothetical protein V3S14_01310 [Anaerolineae bacterium]